VDDRALDSLFLRSFMSRPVSWEYRINEIAARVRNSVIETYGRGEIESAFGIKRAAAQLLMKAIGEISTVGGKHFIARATILEFLNSMNNAENLAEARMNRILYSEPTPRIQRLKDTIPEDLRSIMFRDLPSEISVEQGRIEIRGQNADAVFTALLLLARAIENDLWTFQRVLDPVPTPPLVQDDELRQMFADLKAMEMARGSQPKE